MRSALRLCKPIGIARARAAFSLVEMVMVVATLGIIAMIAVPRMSRAASHANGAAVVANIRILQNAIEHFEAEHNNLNPAQNTDKSVSTNGSRFAQRLTMHTDEFGNAGGYYGPYLLRVPRNPGNDKSTIRIDGLAAGANLAGWRFDSAKRLILPDDMNEATALMIIRLRGKGGKDGAAAEVSIADALEGGG